MIYIAADRHGYKAIRYVEEYLKFHNVPYRNIGVKDGKSDMKLEGMIPLIVKNVLKNRSDRGVLSCGTGVGVEIGANRFKGIEASLVTSEKQAEWSVVYDNCNVLCLVGWGVTKRKVFKILGAWLSAKYDGNEKRLKMIKTFDSWH